MYPSIKPILPRTQIMMQKEIYETLQGLTTALAKFINHLLPAVLDNWWEEGVLKTLTFRQQQIIKKTIEAGLIY